MAMVELLRAIGRGEFVGKEDQILTARTLIMATHPRSRSRCRWRLPLPAPAEQDYAASDGRPLNSLLSSASPQQPKAPIRDISHIPSLGTILTLHQ